MSDVTFSNTLAHTAPRASRAAVSLFQAGVHRGRKAVAFVADLHDTYNLIEAAVLVVAAGFSAAVLAMAFGAQF